MENADKTTYYELYAVICQLGLTPHDGHYITYIKDNSIWHLCDDSAISVADQTEAQIAINRDGYILFYQQIQETLEAPVVKKEKAGEISKKQAPSAKTTASILKGKRKKHLNKKI